MNDSLGPGAAVRPTDKPHGEPQGGPRGRRTAPAARRQLSRWRTTDPLIVLVAAVSLVTYLLHGFHGTLTRDLGLYSYMGQQVAHGVPPYVEVLNRAGPLAHAIPAVGVLVARTGGFDDVITMRVLFMLIAIACVCAVYVLVRDVFTSRVAGLVGAATFLSFYGYIQYATNGPREKTPMTLFIVLALWAVTQRRWFSAGLCVSLATLCLQIAFPASVTAVVVGALLLARGERLRALLRVVVGGVVPVLVLGVWFALAGSLRQSVDGFYFINARYTVPNPVLDDLRPDWLDARLAYGITLWLLFGGLVLLVLRALTVLWPSARRRDPSLLVLAAFAAGAVVGLAWNFRDYDAWPDLFPLLPFAAVGVGAALAWLARTLTVRVATVVAVVFSVAAVVTAVQYSVTSRKDTLDAQRASVNAVMKQLPSDARITSVEAPQALVFAHKTNATRYQMFRGGLQDYMDDKWPGGRDGFRRDMVKDAPDLITVGESVPQAWRHAIEPSYVFVGSAEDWGWYARASLGPAKIAALRKAADYNPNDMFAQPEGAVG